MTPVKVNLTEEKQTLLITLAGHAYDAQSPKPVLGDTMAVEALRKLDHDFSSYPARYATSAAVRAKFIDDWANEFLAERRAENEPATVVHLGCGLDTRVWRLNPGADVEWYDVDYPEVVEIRKQLYPARANYHLIGSSVTEPSWLAEIPADRPTLIVAEGLVMYLTQPQGHELMRRLTDHFPTGTIVFDAHGRLAIKMQNRNKTIRSTGAVLKWGIDSPGELVRAVPGLRCQDAVSALFAGNTRDALPWFGWVAIQPLRLIPAMRRIGWYFRYSF